MCQLVSRPVLCQNRDHSLEPQRRNYRLSGLSIFCSSEKIADAPWCCTTGQVFLTGPACVGEPFVLAPPVGLASLVESRALDHAKFILTSKNSASKQSGGHSSKVWFEKSPSGLRVVEPRLTSCPPPKRSFAPSKEDSEKPAR